MAIKNAGSSLRFSEIESEFGRNNKRSLGDYRVSDNFANQRGGHGAILEMKGKELMLEENGIIDLKILDV